MIDPVATITALEFNSQGQRVRDYGTLLLACNDVQIHGTESRYYQHANNEDDTELLQALQSIL